MTNKDNRTCPHCGDVLGVWEGPPESGWGELLVCDNDYCEFFLGGNAELAEQSAKESLSCRYAENPENNNAPFNLLAWCPRHLREEYAAKCAAKA